MTVIDPPAITRTASLPSTRSQRSAHAVRAGSDAALYEGTMRHRRHEPVSHAFAAKLFFAFLDVDALPASLDRFPMWSARRAAMLRFRREDYLDGTDRPLGVAVRDLVETRTGRRPTGPVHILTQVRTAGWVFNPLSIYFCFSPDGFRVESIVLEVTNTPWKERWWYVVEVTADRPNGPWEFPKAMHVSPFLDRDLTYRLCCAGPGDKLIVHLEDRKAGRTIFEADLALRRIDLDRRRALTVALRHPLLTWRVTASIHLHAVRIWRKGVPVVPHLAVPVECELHVTEGAVPS